MTYKSRQKHKSKKKYGIRYYKKKAWKLMSIWVRKSNADFAGYVKCSTCPASHLWNSGLIHAGHWIHNKLDFERNNINPQCRNCNYKYNKNVNASYAIFMAKKYGVEEMERLRRLSVEKGNRYTILELREIIEDLEIKIKSL